MDLIYHIFGYNIEASLLVILNLIIIESLLSIDNAAVLATMVVDLPEEKRSKALKYGIIGAYFFRGLCLVAASWVVAIWWLKPLAGFYLIYLGIKYFLEKRHQETKQLKINNNSKLFNKLKAAIGPLWATVLLVEVMDLAFSLDNVFAAVAFSDHIYVVMIGVFIGILAMRFVALYFVKLIIKYPLLKDMAFAIIILLGIKLFVSFPCEFLRSSLCRFLRSQASDMWFSVLTIVLFIYPFLQKYFLKNKSDSSVYPLEDTEINELTDKEQQ